VLLRFGFMAFLQRINAAWFNVRSGRNTPRMLISSVKFKSDRDVSAKYGRTSWREQLADIEFMLAELKMSWGLDGPKIPVFLMGHSMV